MTTWFEVEVWLPGRGPLRTLAKGENWEEAKAYAEKRYPRSIAFPVEAAAAKPELVRSKNGPKKTAQEKRRLVQQESRS